MGLHSRRWGAVLAAACFIYGCECNEPVVPDDGGDGGNLDGATGDGGGADANLPDGALPDGALDAGPMECVDATECETLFGLPPCGAWECNGGACNVVCPGCTDADGDGYGPEAACAGPDCDDSDDTLGADGVRTCYSGPSGTAGVGECLSGSEVCIAGVLGPCTGSLIPSGEACNAQDDDCDGSTDEALGDIHCGVGACAATASACVAGGALGMCTPGTPAANDTSCDGIDSDCDGAIDENCATCTKVSGRIGNDTNAIADGNVTPFATIQAAIDWAAADATRPRTVCVASGAGCNANRTYTEAVVMADGISVRGRYEDAAFTACAITTNGTTTIAPGVPEGVVFPSTVSAPTSLADFDIARATSTTTAGVTLDGATNAILARIMILTTPASEHSYGVNLINGAAATITKCSIYGGLGTMESIGVRSVGSTPSLIDNCQGLDPSTGRCDDFCNTGRTPSIRGSFGPAATGDAFGVLLDDSPGARIEQSAICGNDADNGAGVRITGDATGVLIRGNLINAWGGAIDSHGIWMTDCGGAAPWIVDNELIAAAGDTTVTRVDGVRAVGDCHPVIDSNVRITGGGEGGTSGANGVFCGASTGAVASRCVVLGNLLIQGSSNGFPPTSVGVRCENGSCLRIADNVVDARGGVETWGVWLDRTGTFVDDNQIGAGCATVRSIGVYTEDAYARLQNNVILGGTCPPGGVAGASRTTGIHVVVDATANQLDVHSNTIDGQGRVGACTSAAVTLDGTAATTTARTGVYRNNILRAGVCNTRYDFAELLATVDPRIFENNDLDPTPVTTVVYRDEDTTDLSDETMVNALTDMTVSGNLSVDPMFVGTYHIAAGSMCVDAGTTAGAPILDFDDATRDATPDIGADEI